MGHPVPPPRARELAALLTAGPGAALSHVTAGHVYAIFRAEPPVVHVTVPSSTRARSRDGLVIHRAETQLLRLLRRIGAQPTAMNTRIAGHEVDVLFAEERLIVELDGFAAHGTRRAFERDHIRDADLAAAGYRTVRVTWRRLSRETRALERTLERALTS